MIDIHAHILPGLDDGAQDLIDAVLMAELAVEGGTSVLIATPHGNNERKKARPLSDKDYLEKIKQEFDRLQNELKKRELPLRLIQGMEVLCTEDTVRKLARKELVTLNGTRCILAEFDFDASGVFCRRRIEELIEAGLRPVIAHPERYACVQQKHKRAEEWADMGCLLQVNKSSLRGSFGRGEYEAGWTLIKNGAVTFVASDAHSPYYRTPFLGETREMLSCELSKRKANRLLRENAEELLLSQI